MRPRRRGGPADGCHGRRVMRGAALLVAVAVQLLGCVPHADSAPDVAAQPPVVREFCERVRQYAELHRRVASTLPAPRETHDTADITARQRALAAALRQARPDAERGEIFTPAVTAYFRRIIRGDVQQTGTALASAVPAEKPHVVLRVNDEYPDGAPLATVPPLLLRRLPPLPEELEYRFVGEHLLLLDRGANLMVDYIPSASPAKP